MDIAKAFFFAFVPLAILTFTIVYLSFRNGIVSVHDDKDEWSQSNEDFVDDMLDTEDKPTNNYLHSKWVSFGGGFYGLMALLTFAYIEVVEISSFLMTIEGWETIKALLNIDALVDIIIASVMNMVDAFVWFFYWPDQITMGNGWIWLGMAYGGYSLGRWLATHLLDR